MLMLKPALPCSSRTPRSPGKPGRYASIGLLLLSGTVLIGQGASPTMPPEAERQLAREIYKEMVEIKSGLHDRRDDAGGRSRGAAAQGGRLPRRRHLRRRRDPDEGEPRRSLPRHRPAPSDPAARAHRRRGSEARRLEHGSVHVHRKDGYFYGRGTGDDKAQAAIWIANLIRYKREGFKPDRDIIVALTADEEGGGPYNGVEWLLKNKRDLIDAEFCLNEGGWGESVAGKRISNDVQVSEKYVINYRLEVRNKGGHSSLPVPDNAIYHLAGALDRLSKFAFPLKTNEVTRAYFRAMAKIETACDPRTIWRRSPTARRTRWTRGARDHRLERDAAHDLRGDAARGRTRQERAAAARGRERELPRAAGRRRRTTSPRR